MKRVILKAIVDIYNGLCYRIGRMLILSNHIMEIDGTFGCITDALRINYKDLAT